MQIDAIIQARVGSTRLPGKIFKKILGKPLLWHVVERVRAAKKIKRIIIATTLNPQDNKIVDFAKKMKLPWFCGSEKDVLDRYYQTGKNFGSEIIVRVTSDDPFKDPKLIDKFVGEFLKRKGTIDYLSNTIEPTYPEGLDLEIFSFKALKKAWQEAKKPSEREHVTPYIYKHPNKFRLFSLKHKENLSHFRWTIDYPQDLKFAREIYKRLYPKKKIFTMEDVLDLLQKEPSLLEINQGIIFHEGYLKSLEGDKNVK
jgi:spore coat polysaccharide biosynthesis protein SpsF